MISRGIFAITVSTLLLYSSLAAQDTIPRCITTITCSGFQNQEAEALITAFKNRIQASGKCSIISDSTVDSLNFLNSSKPPELFLPDTLRNFLEKEFNADQLLYGNIQRTGKSYSFFASRINLHTGATIQSISQTFTGQYETLLNHEIPVFVDRVVGSDLIFGEKGVKRSAPLSKKQKRFLLIASSTLVVFAIITLSGMSAESK